MAKTPAFDRFLLSVAPVWAEKRARARLRARHFEAAELGRRTSEWPRRGTDVNTAAASSLGPLRYLARDLDRNNAWAKNGVRCITRNVVGTGFVPKPVGGWAGNLRETWRRWAETTECDVDGRLTLAGLAKLAARTMVISGEVLIRRRWRLPQDGLSLPLQLQVLEPDYIDTSRTGFIGPSGGPVIQGVEFDKLGRRAAYWLFPAHPGSNLTPGASKRYPAEDFAHIFETERPGQVRAASWLASVIVSLRDFDEYEDAVLVAQKVAASFAAFRTGGEDMPALGPDGTDPRSGAPVETIEPGSIIDLAPGQDVKFSTPPTVQNLDFSARTLRRIAAGLGVTYEDLTGDFSQVNFSSARMARLGHWANVYDWQWNTMVPQFCDVVWGWAMEAAQTDGLISDPPAATWTAQPMSLTDPDKEARANVIRMRSGQASLPQVLRELGIDEEEHLEEIAETNARLDKLGIWLDSDPRRVSQSGQASLPAAGGAAPGPEKPTEDDAEDTTDSAA
jgi:lambda family phage portal protein